MNKKFVQAIACLSFLALVIGIAPVSYATTTTTDSSYNTPIYRSEFNFSATLNGGQVDMTWTPYAPAGFNYYKVIRSTTNPNPVYPEDSYIKADGNPDASSYTDTSVPSGTVYYRVCSIVKPDRYCSTVIAMSSDGSSSPVTEPVTTTIEPATLSLTASMESDGVQLNWTIDGESPQGFKLALSTVNENPTYPVMSGDSYRYFSDSTKRSYADVKVQVATTYHYRVCQYNGAGVCLAYSNAVSVSVPVDFVSSYIYEKPTITVVKTTTTYTGEFADVSTHDYVTAIDYLKDKAIVSGYDDGTFKPDNPINRAEFMKIVMEAKFSADLSVGVEQYCFFDVHDAWYAPYICLGKVKGIVGGYSDGTFKPAQYISFVEAAKILSEVYSLNVVSGGAWYEGYVKALQSDNYIPSTIGQLDKSITRAEMAELIWRIKEQKTDQASVDLISEPITVSSGDYAGWATYNGDGFAFNHPNWYQGVKWGWDLLTDEKDFIDNINVPNYMAVDSYISIYTAGGSDLNTTVWFDHPLVSSQELTINGVPALKRHYRAPRGTVVNGRTTGENENITIYTYRIDGKVAVLQYFNAYGTENYNVETFYQIAESFIVR
jgi:hypothetical protein